MQPGDEARLDSLLNWCHMAQTLPKIRKKKKLESSSSVACKWPEILGACYIRVCHVIVSYRTSRRWLTRRRPSFTSLKVTTWPCSPSTTRGRTTSTRLHGVTKTSFRFEPSSELRMCASRCWVSWTGICDFLCVWSVFVLYWPRVISVVWI